ncbi:hypothetical protein DVH05_025663 [Phytophthora capsici]|nr:hypothetical protein DVH05_025663 [Phytophthora capsici]
MSYGSGGVHGTYVGEFWMANYMDRVYAHTEATKLTRRTKGGTKERGKMTNLMVLAFKRKMDAQQWMFKCGLQQGPGAIKFANGDTYEGTFEKGDLHGEGRFVYRDGGVYEGAFVLSKRHGKGTRVFAHGDRYEGDWMNDLMHGRGVKTSKVIINSRDKRKRNGGTGVLKYDGEFRNGQLTGEASITYEFKPQTCERPEKEEGDNLEWDGEFEFPEGSGCWHRGRGRTTYKGGVL